MLSLFVMLSLDRKPFSLVFLVIQKLCDANVLTNLLCFKFLIISFAEMPSGSNYTALASSTFFQSKSSV